MPNGVAPSGFGDAFVAVTGRRVHDMRMADPLFWRETDFNCLAVMPIFSDRNAAIPFNTVRGRLRSFRFTMEKRRLDRGRWKMDKSDEFIVRENHAASTRVSSKEILDVQFVGICIVLKRDKFVSARI